MRRKVRKKNYFHISRIRRPGVFIQPVVTKNKLAWSLFPVSDLLEGHRGKRDS